jgi:arginase
MQDWKIIEVPFESGSDRRGSGLAPRWLTERCFGAVEHVKLDVEYNGKNGAEQYGVKNYECVLDISARLRDEVAAWREKREKVLVIGGDHAIALGSIAGVLEENENLGVIWFDAHGDVNTEATSPSMNAHGMPVAALLGECASRLNDIARTRLKKENIFWVGARDLDEGEWSTIERLGIMDYVYSTELVHDMGMAAVMKDIKRKMEAHGVEAVHLSFDIDGMDPSIVWATGTRVENGLMQEDLDAFINGLRELPEMRSMDFVEYNPLMDDDMHTTGKWCVETLKRLIEK